MNLEKMKRRRDILTSIILVDVVSEVTNSVVEVQDRAVLETQIVNQVTEKIKGVNNNAK